MDRASLGSSGAKDLEFAGTRSARDRLSKALKTACVRCARDEVSPVLSTFLDSATGGHRSEVVIDETDPDAQSLLARYPTVLGAPLAAYITPAVKIELGARSGDEPAMEPEIAPLISEVLPSWARKTRVRRSRHPRPSSVPWWARCGARVELREMGREMSVSSTPRRPGDPPEGRRVPAVAIEISLLFISCIPVLVVFFLLQRYFIGGMVAGAVKE